MSGARLLVKKVLTAELGKTGIGGVLRVPSQTMEDSRTLSLAFDPNYYSQRQRNARVYSAFHNPARPEPKGALVRTLCVCVGRCGWEGHYVPSRESAWDQRGPLVAMRRVSIMFHHVNSASSKPEALSGRLIFASGWRRPMYYQIVPEPDDLAP